MNLIERCNKCELKECIGCEFTWSDLQETIEPLQKENEKYISGELITRNQAKHFEEINKKYYIHKDKIREKIEELNKKEKEELKGVKGSDRHYIKLEYMYKKNVLQDLLKEE